MYLSTNRATWWLIFIPRWVRSWIVNPLTRARNKYIWCIFHKWFNITDSSDIAFWSSMTRIYRLISSPILSIVNINIYIHTYNSILYFAVSVFILYLIYTPIISLWLIWGLNKHLGYIHIYIYIYDGRFNLSTDPHDDYL